MLRRKYIGSGLDGGSRSRGVDQLLDFGAENPPPASTIPGRTTLHGPTYRQAHARRFNLTSVEGLSIYDVRTGGGLLGRRTKYLRGNADKRGRGLKFCGCHKWLNSYIEPAAYLATNSGYCSYHICRALHVILFVIPIQLITTSTRLSTPGSTIHTYIFHRTLNESLVNLSIFLGGA